VRQAAIACGSMANQTPASRSRASPSLLSGCTTKIEGMAVILTMAALAEAVAVKIRCAPHHGGNATATTSVPGRTCNDSAAIATKLVISRRLAASHALHRDVVTRCDCSIRENHTEIKIIAGKCRSFQQVSAHCSRGPSLRRNTEEILLRRNSALVPLPTAAWEAGAMQRCARLARPALAGPRRAELASERVGARGYLNEYRMRGKSPHLILEAANFDLSPQAGRGDSAPTITRSPPRPDRASVPG